MQPAVPRIGPHDCVRKSRCGTGLINAGLVATMQPTSNTSNGTAAMKYRNHSAMEFAM